MVDSMMDDDRAMLLGETRAQVEQARTRMVAAVAELTAAVRALRDDNEAVTEVWRQRLPAEWGGPDHMTLVRGGARTFPTDHVSVLRNAMN